MITRLMIEFLILMALLWFFRRSFAETTQEDVEDFMIYDIMTEDDLLKNDLPEDDWPAD